MSTAKSMATQYLNAKRTAGGGGGVAGAGKSSTLAPISQHRFKSSVSNLAANSQSSGSKSMSNSLKATSMTNLRVVSEQQQQQQQNRLQRPASRNALDSIHNGMNAKYAQVQSKVLLQNIRPQQQPQQQQQPQSKIPAGRGDTTLTRRAQAAAMGGAGGATNRASPSPIKAPNERSAMINKLKSLQDELERAELERENLKQELERERADKLEQATRLKGELQDKLAEHDKQNEEYHQKLLEAYELADQNRRAADSVLNESRQRDEEARKKIEELQGQLNELKEFVSMKEEMTGKLYELKEQIREERLRYEEQLKSLHQVFESEKISHKNRGAQVSSGGNYFSRIKPALNASSESIQVGRAAGGGGGGGGCRTCLAGSSQLHKSEQDIYGSKLSTRMQDTAKSAWKSSKKFASSVITGGVGLAGCRRRSGDLSGQRAKSLAAGATSRPVQQQQLDQQQLQQPSRPGQHTSVVQINDGAPATPVAITVGSEQPRLQAGENSSLIRVDASNKLTIVTKFNQDELVDRGQSSAASSAPQSIEMAPSSASGASGSSTASERSRCESSSSGRGTSNSDAGSAASQNGDDKDDHPAAAAAAGVQTAPTSREEKPAELLLLPDGDHGDHGANQQPATSKTHKRKSSLFKARKVVFGGSQVSLNKLKSFFNGSGSGGGAIKSDKAATQQQQQLQLDEATAAAAELATTAESSRLRCLELNQAINVPSISAQMSPVQLCVAASDCASDCESAGAGGRDHDDEKTQASAETAAAAAAAAARQQVEIGQGESGQQQQQQQAQAATASAVVCC